MKRHFLVWLRNHSTHWRATCRYNTDGTVYTEYLRASFEDFDIVRVTPTLIGDCQKYELVNIRGIECANCTAKTWYLKGTFPLHIDSTISDGCDFDGTQSVDVVASEDNFGLYYNVNSKFRCTSSSEATTQFWFGSKWFHKRGTMNISVLPFPFLSFVLSFFLSFFLFFFLSFSLSFLLSGECSITGDSRLPYHVRRGSRGDEMGEFSPPFFWANFFLFFSYPSNIDWF